MPLDKFDVSSCQFVVEVVEVAREGKAPFDLVESCLQVVKQGQPLVADDM